MVDGIDMDNPLGVLTIYVIVNAGILLGILHIKYSCDCSVDSKNSVTDAIRCGLLMPTHEKYE